MGTVPGYVTDCPEPGAFLVKFGPKYITTSREVTDELWAKLVRGASIHYGFDYDPQVKPWNQYHMGEMLSTFAHRWEIEQDEQQQAHTQR